MNMNMNIPYDILNIIFQFYAELGNRKWKLILDPIKGKPKWNINKYNKSTTKIQKILQLKIENPPTNIRLLYNSLECIAIFTLIKKIGDDNRIKLLLDYKRNGYDESCYISLWKNKDFYSDGLFINDLQSYVFREYLPDPTFWATNIKDIIWNDYGITLIHNDYIGGWEGEWILVNNEWKFNIVLPNNFDVEQQEIWEPNDNEWDDEWPDELDADP